MPEPQHFSTGVRPERLQFSQQMRNIKDIANQIVSAEMALRALQVAQQIAAFSLAGELRRLFRLRCHAAV